MHHPEKEGQVAACVGGQPWGTCPPDQARTLYPAPPANGIDLGMQIRLQERESKKHPTFGMGGRDQLECSADGMHPLRPPPPNSVKTYPDKHPSKTNEGKPECTYKPWHINRNEPTHTKVSPRIGLSDAVREESLTEAKSDFPVGKKIFPGHQSGTVAKNLEDPGPQPAPTGYHHPERITRLWPDPEPRKLVPPSKHPYSDHEADLMEQKRLAFERMHRQHRDGQTEENTPFSIDSIYNKEIYEKQNSIFLEGHNKFIKSSRGPGKDRKPSWEGRAAITGDSEIQTMHGKSMAGIPAGVRIHFKTLH